MKVLFHPEFPKDVRKFAGDYRDISPGLEERFRIEVDEAISAVKVSPTAAGHFLQTGSAIITDVRRRNLRSFPRRRGNCTALRLASGLLGKPRKMSWSFERLIFGSVIPSRSDPLTWLSRLGPTTPNPKS